jgi:hypothetical protein
VSFPVLLFYITNRVVEIKLSFFFRSVTTHEERERKIQRCFFPFYSPPLVYTLFLDIDDLGLPDHPLLNDPPYHNNRCSRIKRIWIIIGSLSFTVLIIAFAASMLLMHIRRQQEKPLSINKFSTSTKSTTLNKFTKRTTNLKISGK